MSIKKSVFDSIINKAFIKVNNKFYFAPAGNYWKAYTLERKEQVDELKIFLGKFLWIVFFFMLFSIVSFEPKVGLYIYLLFLYHT